MKISELTAADPLNGSELFVIVQNGNSRKCSVSEILSSAPDSHGLYPDVPLNRVTIKRYASQTSTTMTVCDNVGLIDKIKATAYPVLLDRNSRIAAYLNGNNMQKTVDGLTAVLDDWTLQSMVRMGGIWYKYYYVAATNEKVFHFSPYKVRGYKYIRRRFLNCFGGVVETHDNKSMLLSIADRFTTQSVSLANFHTYAKNLGTSYREIATQDREVYRFYFWLMEQTFNSQSILRGICDVGSSWWAAYSRTADGGQSTYGQFHKTGETLSITGHKGEKTLTVNNGSSDATVKPNKWLWRENMLAGPYWIWETGYCKKNGKWYRALDINTVTGFDPTDTTKWEELCDSCNTDGYILEDFQDTLIPSAVGGSDTTGMADYNYQAQTENTVYIPAGVGYAFTGSTCGVSVLSSDSGASGAHAGCGGALASDDPTDVIADGTVAA